MVRYERGVGGMKILFSQVYGWVCMDMQKPVTSRVFDDHTLGTRWVFGKYITWYKLGLLALTQFFGWHLEHLLQMHNLNHYTLDRLESHTSTPLKAHVQDMSHQLEFQQTQATSQYNIIQGTFTNFASWAFHP